MSVIDGATNTVTSTIPVGTGPYAVAVAGWGTAYVTNTNSNSVSMIDGATNAATATIPVGPGPARVATSGCYEPTVAAVVAGGGRSMDVKGTGFPPSTSVTITVGSVTLGTATSRSDGSFDATCVTIDHAATSGTLMATGGGASATTNVTLTPCSTPVTPAFTG